MPDLDDDEMTLLLDADFPRVDLVGRPANGVPRFLIAKQAEDASGLLDPGFVRSLIGKQAEPEPADDGKVTMTGSPAAIAAMIHKAAQRAAEPEQVMNVSVRASVLDPGQIADEIRKAAAAYEAVIKEKYSAEDKRKMLAASHAIENEDGDPAFPIGDEDDLGKAIHAVGRGGPDHDRIRAYVIRRAKALGKSSTIPDNWASDGSLKEDSVSKTAAVTKDMGPELDGGADGMDPTVPLAAPEIDAPGDPADPGSPAWEAIDAATACKWTAILARAMKALEILAEREMLEAASADPDDAENAWDLQDAACAIDYAISVLAPFAVAEQSEADCGADEMAAAIGKAMAGFDPAPLDRIEGFAAIAKSGRVLSAANEAHIREAAQRLNTVLSSLPQAPATDDGQPVAKQKGTTVAETQTKYAAPVAKADAGKRARGTGPVDAGGTAGPADALPAGGPQEALPGDVQDRQVIKGAAVGVFGHDRRFLGLADSAAILTDIAKADGEKTPMCVVYDQKGRLIGIVDPSDITPVSNAEAGPDEAPDDGGGAAPAAADGDMTPAPPASAGTPADDVAKGGTQDPAPQGAQESTDTRTVLKSIVTEALAEILGAQGPAQDIAKQADVAGLSGRLEDVLARLETVEKMDARPGVFTHGATPPPGSVPPARPSLRGQDQGASSVIDVAKARAMKQRMYTADPAEANRIAAEMNRSAIAALEQIHSGARQ